MSDEQPILLAEGFEEAFFGVGCRVGLPKLAIYSIPKAVTLLERRGMSRTEARAYLYAQADDVDLGTHTPVWVEEMTVDELRLMVRGDHQVH